MAWYDIGTVSVTNGSTTVTGSGTNFIAGVQIGEAFTSTDGRLYEIQAIVSATVLTLANPYLGSTQTGQDYTIVPTQSLVATLASEVSSLISDFQSVKDEAGEGKFNDGTAALPGITFNLDQDTGFSRPAANQIGFSTAGVQRALLSSTALTVSVPITITGGTIDGASIGATTASTGAFTTLTTTGTINNLTVGRGGGNISTNTTIGVTALRDNTTGDNNTAVGHTALRENITGRLNSAFGSAALRANTAGDNNLAVGHSALLNNTTGSSNTAIGQSAGLALTTGDNNTIIGRIAGTAGLSDTVIIGAGTNERLRIDSSGNVGIGTTSPTSALTVQGTITGTAVTQSATDTTAGRLMKVGDAGLLRTGDQQILADVDAINTPTGMYRTDSSTLNIGGFSSAFNQMLIQRWSATDVSQIWIRNFRPGASVPQLFYRVYNSGSWGPIQRVLDGSQILGTVSQSSGVPTGAVIQRGSNANGEFVRYADGTQICWKIDHELAFVNASTVRGDWTFPAAFSSEVRSISFTLRRSSSASVPNSYRESGYLDDPVGVTQTSTARLVLLSDGGMTDEGPAEVSATAIGRWF